MTKFISKSIDQLTLGERLRQARQGLNLDLATVGREIQIKKDYLELIEHSEYSKLPSLVYVENYLKVYTGYLGLDWAQLQSIYEKEIAFLPKPEKQKLVGHLHKSALYLPRFFYLAAIIILLAVIFSYLGWQVNNLLKPPPINLTSPLDNLTISERSIIVSGATSTEATVTINGQEIKVDQNGQFTEAVSLQPGFNNLKITAKTKHSREQTVYRQILVEQPE